MARQRAVHQPVPESDRSAAAQRWFPRALLVPMIAVTVFSWGGTPLMVPRYLRASLVAFFVLAALGAASVENRLAVLGLASALALVYLQRIHHHFRRPQGAQRREAVELARANAGPQGQIAVVPEYAAPVLRYYLPADSRRRAVGLEKDCRPARVAIVAGATYIPAGVGTKTQVCYPRVLARLRHLEVRAR